MCVCVCVCVCAQSMRIRPRWRRVEDSRPRRVRGAVINKNAGTRGIHKGARPVHCTNTYTVVYNSAHTHTLACARDAAPGRWCIVEGPAQRSRIYIIPRQPRPNPPHRALRDPAPRVPRSTHRDKIDHPQSSSTLPAPRRRRPSIISTPPSRPPVQYIINVCVCVCVSEYVSDWRLYIFSYIIRPTAPTYTAAAAAAAVCGFFLYFLTTFRVAYIYSVRSTPARSHRASTDPTDRKND